MSDTNATLPPELQSKFEEGVLIAFEKHREEVRRSFEISNSFYDKLSALDAGSIALAASVGFSIIARAGTASGLHTISHWPVFIICSLWVSLVCAVLHNFVGVRIARLEADYSDHDLVRKMMRQGLSIFSEVQPEIDKSVIAHLGELVQKEPFIKQQRNVRNIQTLSRCSTALGYISIGAFLLAYTLVVICVVRIWFQAR
jgi:hypothetical protein